VGRRAPHHGQANGRRSQENDRLQGSGQQRDRELVPEQLLFRRTLPESVLVRAVGRFSDAAQAGVPQRAAASEGRGVVGCSAGLGGETQEEVQVAQALRDGLLVRHPVRRWPQVPHQRVQLRWRFGFGAAGVPLAARRPDVGGRAPVRGQAEGRPHVGRRAPLEPRARGVSCPPAGGTGGTEVEVQEPLAVRDGLLVRHAMR